MVYPYVHVHVVSTRDSIIMIGWDVDTPRKAFQVPHCIEKIAYEICVIIILSCIRRDVWLHN